MCMLCEAHECLLGCPYNIHFPRGGLGFSFTFALNKTKTKTITKTTRTPLSKRGTGLYLHFRPQKDKDIDIDIDKDKDKESFQKELLFIFTFANICNIMMVQDVLITTTTSDKRRYNYFDLPTLFRSYPSHDLSLK